MSRHVKMLAGVLVLQVLLIVRLLSDWGSENPDQVKWLQLDSAKVEQLQISDGETDVELTRNSAQETL